MAEVTQVPQQPIAKGSLMKFWLGVLVGIALSALVAFATTYERGVSLDTITAGEGPNPGEEDVVWIEYVGTLEDGTEFDRSPPDLGLPPEVAGMVPQGVPMELNGVVPGFRQGLMQTQEGGQYELFIPAAEGYGSSPPPGAPIPPDADLTFNVTVHKIMTAEEMQQLGVQVQMAMMQAQQDAESEEAAAE